MKSQFVLLLMGCVCACTGCGTVATRAMRSEFSDKFPAVYPATYCDVGLISAPCRSSFSGSAGKKAGACIVGIIDLPISVAVDTLLLPYDVITAAAEE